MNGAITIQERLKDLRLNKGLKLEELAEQTGISKSALGSYEKDDYKEINHGNLILLADFYGVSLDYLFCRQGSSISLPKVMALHRRGSISHTGWSFDWNNPSMNYLYHRTFLCLVRYVHKVGIRGKNQKFPRLRKV